MKLSTENRDGKIGEGAGKVVPWPWMAACCHLATFRASMIPFPSLSLFESQP